MNRYTKPTNILCDECGKAVTLYDPLLPTKEVESWCPICKTEFVGWPYGTYHGKRPIYVKC